MSNIPSEATSRVLSAIAYASNPNDHDVAEAVCTAISRCEGSDPPEVNDAMPRVGRLRQGLSGATVSFLRDVARADAEGTLSVPMYVAMTQKLERDQLDAVERALWSLLPPRGA